MAWAETLLFKKLVIGFSMKEAVFVEHPGLSNFHLEKKILKWRLVGRKLKSGG